MVDLGKLGRPKFQFQSEFRQDIRQTRFGRVEQVGGIRAFRLQIERHAMPVGELAQQFFVGRIQWFENAQHQGRAALAHGQLDLRQALADR